MVFGQCDASYGTLKDEENWKTCCIYHKPNFYDICMDPLVYFQGRGSGKMFTTYITQKTLVTDVVHLVRFQVRSCHKSFATYITKEGPVTSVNPAVLIQITSCVVGLAALNTHIGFITCVGPLMQLQALGLAKSPAAYITHKCLTDRVDFLSMYQ